MLGRDFEEIDRRGRADARECCQRFLVRCCQRTHIPTRKLLGDGRSVPWKGDKVYLFFSTTYDFYLILIASRLFLGMTTNWNCSIFVCQSFSRIPQTVPRSRQTLRGRWRGRDRTSLCSFQRATPVTIWLQKLWCSRPSLQKVTTTVWDVSCMSYSLVSY